MAEKTVVVLIPSLNPDDKFLALLRSIKAYQQTPDALSLRVLVVNDGSGPSYDRFFDAARAEFGCTVLRHPVNLGKGAALKTAFQFILNEWPDCAGAVTADSDGQHCVEDMIACARDMMAHPEALILGCRQFADRSIPFRSRFGNRITSRMLRVLYGLPLSDTQTGLRGISPPLMVKFLPVEGQRFEYEMNMITATAQLSIPLREVPIRTIYIENNATSHFHPVRDSVRVYRTFWPRIRRSLLVFALNLLLFAFLLSRLPGEERSFLKILFASFAAGGLTTALHMFLFKAGTFIGRRAFARLVWFCTLTAGELLLSSAVLAGLVRLATLTDPLAIMGIKGLIDLLFYPFCFFLQTLGLFRARAAANPAKTQMPEG